jgi:hypothetical protein
MTDTSLPWHSLQFRLDFFGKTGCAFDLRAYTQRRHGEWVCQLADNRIWILLKGRGFIADPLRYSRVWHIYHFGRLVHVWEQLPLQAPALPKLRLRPTLRLIQGGKA